MRAIEPSLTLVGAGPGDPELISLKGIRAIQQADVILYDALVNEELLEYARAHCTKIYVGKRAEQPSTSQDQINQLIVDYAKTHGHVVRLKGGDPFIFGRGGEEIEFARAHGIATRAVPGISSSTGLTALEQIPTTYRGVAESYWVITGSTKEGRLSNDLRQAAQTSATVIVLMGYAKLTQIVALYNANNRENLPIALIQNGSLPNQKVVIGQIKNILEKAEEEAIAAPAIIVLGEVVSKHKDFQQLIKKYEPITVWHE